LAELGKRPQPDGWVKAFTSRIEDACSWLVAYGIDELWILDHEGFYEAELNVLVELLRGTSCTAYLCTNVREGSTEYRPPRPAKEVGPVHSEGVTSWVEGFLQGRDRVLSQMDEEKWEWADRCMRRGFESTLSLGESLWEGPQREHLFAAMIASANPTRRILRAVGAQCALLQHGYIVELAGDPTGDQVIIADSTAAESVKRMPNPDYAAALTLRLLPLPSAVLAQVTVGAVSSDGKGEVSIGGYRFRGHMAAALRAACLDGDRPRDPEERLIRGQHIPRMSAAKAPFSTGGLQVKFTAVRDVSDRNRNRFVNRCAVVSALAQCGWTRTVSIADIPARIKAAQDLVADGLLQEIDGSHFSSTRELRFNQFALH